MKGGRKEEGRKDGRKEGRMEGVRREEGRKDGQTDEQTEYSPPPFSHSLFSYSNVHLLVLLSSLSSIFSTFSFFLILKDFSKKQLNILFRAIKVNTRAQELKAVASESTTGWKDGRGETGGCNFLP